MSTVYIKQHKQKFEMLYDLLLEQQPVGPDAKKWKKKTYRNGEVEFLAELSRFVAWAFAVRTGADKAPNPLRNKYSSSEELLGISRGLYERICIAFSIPVDAEWFCCQNDSKISEVEDLARFEEASAGHFIRPIQPPKIKLQLEATNSQPDIGLGKAITNIDLFTTGQEEDFLPFLEIKPPVIRIPDAKYPFVYGFNALRIDIKFLQGRNIRLINRKGFKTGEAAPQEPFMVGENIMLEIISGNRHPQFRLRQGDHTCALTEFMEIPEIGLIQNARAGDRVTVDLLVELSEQRLAFAEDIVDPPDDQLREIYQLLVSEKILMATGEEVITLNETYDCVILDRVETEVIAVAY